ncbi:OB-fold nucleic acid binding domain protein [Posidoniimonas polymericola]|uniref:OB-fold nucleic acid binding domain protein n=1 Tax=Posidoniimonas polymericola TaxID=2528002 RepID=A0A5C5YS36_9BACT|nr:hypothetical protein [Posidoniimonas polymericola]TWT77643.1 OB-fold nucleic acid binding domain protein [Posidoniimonas polymericola]
MKITLWRSIAVASMGFAPLAVPANANAASDARSNTTNARESWIEQSPYYEQEAWYDVTEWFDGDDYTRTEEAWNDDSEGDGYSYDYRGSESNADSNSYGYDNRNGGDNWFYDYYDGQYFTYDDLSNDRIYRSAAVYSDYDNDGYFDAVLTAYDSNGDGLYESGDYYTLNSTADQKQGKQSKQGQQPQQSRQQELTGTVKNVKRASVRDTKHLVAMVKTDSGKQFACDLGPAKDMKNVDLAQGDKLTVAGPALKVGDKRVVMADWVKLQDSDQKTKVDRSEATLQGKVVDTKKASIRGQKHLLVKLKTDAGKKCLCDLGPADELDANFEQGDQLKVTGVPAKANGRKLVLAESVTIDGDKTRIHRAERLRGHSGNQSANSERHTSGQQALTSVQGEVRSTRQLSVRGNERNVAVIDANDGRQMLIDLGSADASQVSLQQGDRIQAKGIVTKAKNGKPVLLARTVMHDGQTTRIDNRQQRSSLTSASEISGKVQQLKTVTVNDSERQLARIKTDDGRTATVDFGSPDQDAGNISQGDTITAEGVSVKVADKTILVAFEVSPENGDSFKVDRGFDSQSDRSPASRR